MDVIKGGADLARETPARREADAGRLEAPRVVVHERAEVLLDQSTRRDDGMLALGHAASQLRVVGAKKGEHLAEQFRARLVPFATGRDDDVGLLGEEPRLEREFLVASVVNLEPLSEVQRTKAHGE